MVRMYAKNSGDFFPVGLDVPELGLEREFRI